MRKSVIALLAAPILAISLTGCGGSTQNDVVETDDVVQEEVETTPEKVVPQGMQAVEFEGMSVTVPEEWYVEEEEDDATYITPDYGGLVSLAHYTVNAAEEKTAMLEVFRQFTDGIVSSGGFQVTGTVPEEVSYGVAQGLRQEMTYTEDGELYRGWANAIFSGKELYSVLILVPEAEFDERQSDALAILDGAEVANPERPVMADVTE